MSTRPLTRWWSNSSETMAKYRADDDARRLDRIMLALEATTIDLEPGTVTATYTAASTEEARQIRRRLWCRGWRTTLDWTGLTVLFTGERHQDREPPDDLRPTTEET